MALLTDAAERHGTSRPLAFGAMNGAWAAGNVVGPALGGWLAEVAGNSLPYLLLAVVCLLSLRGDVAVRRRATSRRGRGRAARRAAGSAPRTRRRAPPASPASCLRSCARKRAGRRRAGAVGRRELEHLRVCPLGLGEELLAREDQELLAREDSEPAFELLGVPAAGLVGVAPPRLAEVARIRACSRSTSPSRRVSSAASASSKESGSRPSAELVVVVRERAVDRVADEARSGAPQARVP